LINRPFRRESNHPAAWLGSPKAALYRSFGTPFGRRAAVPPSSPKRKARQLKGLVFGQALKLRFLPRYSPDLSPIEPCWSKIKTLLRAKEARSVEALDRELPGILGAISAQDAGGWFRHCGYPPPD
jgi:DDE superfamily endonuclease